MLTNKIYQAIFLLFILTACAPHNAELPNLDSAEPADTSATETQSSVESLQKELEAEREARLRTESELKELKKRQTQRVDTTTDTTSDDKPIVKDDTANGKPEVKENTEIIKTPKTDPTSEIAAEYNEVVNAYVAYLRGLPPEESSSACSSSADLSELNQMQRAALRDACDIVGNRDAVVEPNYPRTNPDTYPQRQPQDDQTVDSLIKIFDAVLRGIGR